MHPLGILESREGHGKEHVAPSPGEQPHVRAAREVNDADTKVEYSLVRGGRSAPIHPRGERQLRHAVL